MPTESGRLPTAEQLGVRLENLHESDQSWIEQLSKFLPNCFSKYFPRWVPTSGASIEQIRKSFERGPSRVVVDQDEQVLGWAAAITDETQWEIHPIAVSPKHQRQGLMGASRSGSQPFWIDAYYHACLATIPVERHMAA
ncbi:MAG TPA: N-acetyltransferase, partial [Dehalococcoidia bacterium]|nr:N-acetyltransferase [Dehalococcoidia bacterium]